MKIKRFLVTSHPELFLTQFEVEYEKNGVFTTHHFSTNSGNWTNAGEMIKKGIELMIDIVENGSIKPE